VDRVKRLLVLALAKLDSAVDEVAYRPAVVRAFRWSPYWWNCAIAKLSVRLDERWAAGYWDEGPVPGDLCAACRRRASPFWIEGPTGEVVPLCGWCHIEGPILSDADLSRELSAAAADSVAWRWRWRAGRDAST
jgi:hypothetical protein